MTRDATGRICGPCRACMTSLAAAEARTTAAEEALAGAVDALREAWRWLELFGEHQLQENGAICGASPCYCGYEALTDQMERVLRKAFPTEEKTDGTK